MLATVSTILLLSLPDKAIETMPVLVSPFENVFRSNSLLIMIGRHNISISQISDQDLSLLLKTREQNCAVKRSPRYRLQNRSRGLLRAVFVLTRTKVAQVLPDWCPQISVSTCAGGPQNCPSHLFFCQITFQALLKAVGKIQKTSFAAPFSCVCVYWLTLCSIYKDQ